MSLKFYPILTQDGSVGLFNEDIQDVYHSRFGAYLEAQEKFISPSGLEKNLDRKQTLRILDICYGMGYNSKSAIEKTLQSDFNGEVFIDALELDENVVAFSFVCKKSPFAFDFLDYIDFAIFKEQKILDSVFSIIENEKFAEFCDPDIACFFKNSKKDLCKSIGKGEIATSLHNI